MSYYVPASGSVIEWADNRAPYLAADAFGVPGLPYPGTDIWTAFDPVPEIPTDQFEEQVRTQTMFEISMGCYHQASRVARHRESNTLYLQVGQSGWGAYFKLYES